jgi:hypothetical protein
LEETRQQLPKRHAGDDAQRAPDGQVALEEADGLFEGAEASPVRFVVVI